MTATAPMTATPTPAATWKALAHLIAARPKLRLFNPETAKFDRTANLTSRLPQQPAAVPLYQRGRTCLLALDFDTKHHSPDDVDHDFAAALSWITESGGVAITDRSTSGGRHILVPLALGTSADVTEINHLMRLLEARLPSLDKTPMTNAATGCITVPGSPCREGGHRLLDGSLPAAVEALTTRSEPGLIPHLNTMLGAFPSPKSAQHAVESTHLTGTGHDTRLDPYYTRHTDYPAHIAAYAATAAFPKRGPWLSTSEARQSVLAHAVLRGHSLNTLRALIAPGRPWHRGLGAAYERYRHSADKALERDFTKALAWADLIAPSFRPVRAQEQEIHRGVVRGSLELRSWLANALAWLESAYKGHRYRWLGAAIFQALAFHASCSGEVINGIPVVGVGGRSLSLATGLLSETAVWEFLREIREVDGAPLVLTRVAQGREPDYYALTQQRRLAVNDSAIVAARVERVHLAWKVIGHRHRRIYELVAHQNLARPAKIFAAAQVSTSTGYTTLAALCTAGLLRRHRGTVTTGLVRLDDIAAAHHLEELHAQRAARHQQQRTAWHTWLDLREALRGLETLPHSGATEHAPASIYGAAIVQQYLASVVATGPPITDDEQHAIELLEDLLGARLITAA